MNRKKIVVKNASLGLIGQVVTVLFQFITRSAFLKFFGVELLGISSTLTSVLSTLSLAELGFQTAIVYSLYKPLNDGDIEKVNSIVNIFKYVYRLIAAFFVVAGILCMPLLKYILKDVEISGYIYIIFGLQVINSSFSYLLAYKRSLLYADQKDFIAKIIDTVFNILFSTIKIFSIILMQNYYWFLIFQILQTIISNLVVHYACLKLYPFLHKRKIDTILFRKIWNDVKNVFASKIATYIYSATDNIVISTFISATSVGYLVNYTTVTKNLSVLISSIFTPIMPVIGNMLADDSNESKEKYFGIFTHVRFLFASAIIVPTIILIDDFIIIWVGSEYVMDDSIVWLLAIDLYISIIYAACYDYINGAGLFIYDKYTQIIGASINIIISISLVNIVGIKGVLLGTVVSQIFFWIGRSSIVYRFCFGNESVSYIKYWGKNLYRLIVVLICFILSKLIYEQLIYFDGVIKIIIGGVITESIILICNLLFFYNFPEQKRILYLFKNLLTKHGKA